MGDGVLTSAPESPPAPPAGTGTSRRTLLLALRSAAGASVVGYVVNLALLPFVIHRLGPDLYGAWIAASALLIVGGLADAGIRVEIIRRVGAAQGSGDPEDLVRSVHQGITLLSAVAGGFLVAGLLGSPAIRALAFPDGVRGMSHVELEWLIRATFGVLAFSLVAKGYCGAVYGLQRSDIEMAAQAAAVPLGAAITVAGVFAGWGIWAMLVGAVGELVILAGWQYVRLRRLLPALRPRLVRMTGAATRAYLALSGLVLIAQLSDVVDSQWDKLVLSHFVGSAAVASFQVGTSLVLQAKALVVVPLAPLLVVIAELRHRDETKMEGYFSLLAKLGMVLAATVLGGVYVFAPVFVRLWLGVELAPAGGAARLFTVASAFGLLIAPLSFRALGEGWHRMVAATAVVNMVVNGALSLAFTIWLGFNGPLYGSIAGNVTGAAVFLVLVRRRLGERWPGLPLGALAVGVASAALALALGVDHVASWPALLAAGAAWTAMVGTASVAVERIPVSVLLRRRLPA